MALSCNDISLYIRKIYNKTIYGDIKNGEYSPFFIAARCYQISLSDIKLHRFFAEAETDKQAESTEEQNIVGDKHRVNVFGNDRYSEGGQPGEQSVTDVIGEPDTA